MKTTRLVGVLVALLSAVLILSAAPANAVARPISVVGKEPGNKGIFYIKGNVGADYDGNKVTLQRRDRPGAKYKNIGQIKVKNGGKFKVRVYSARGSRKTCFRIKAKAVGGYEATKSDVLCIIRS